MSNGGEIVDYGVTPAEIERVLKAAIAAQQPFFTGLLNQVGSIDSRQSRLSEELMLVRDAVHLLVNSRLLEQNREREKEIQELEREHDRRIRFLETELSNRNALMKALDWAPKLIGYLILLIGAVGVYLGFRKI